MAARQDEARFGVRCPRCARTQPGQAAAPAFAGQPGQLRYAGQPTPLNCVYCGAPLAVTRWVATPPPGLGPPPRVRRITRPYAGPPGYGASHPQWGFPPVAKRPPAAEAPVLPRPPLRLTSVAVVAALATALAGLLAAGAEVWRYRLMLTGRFEVLPARPVALSQTLVTAASWVALALAAIALLAATRALQGWSLAAAGRAGVRPPRSPGAIAARLLVPGWNLYGAGQVVVEARRLIRAGITGPWSDAKPGGDQRAARGGHSLLAAAWCAWILNGLLALAVAAISLLPLVSARWAASNQLAANLVLLHVALDVLAALVAVLAAAVLVRLRTEWRGGKPLKYEGWLVAQPESTARNRRDADEDRGLGSGGGIDAGMTEPAAPAGQPVPDTGTPDGQPVDGSLLEPEPAAAPRSSVSAAGITTSAAVPSSTGAGSAPSADAVSSSSVNTAGMTTTAASPSSAREDGPADRESPLEAEPVAAPPSSTNDRDATTADAAVGDPGPRGRSADARAHTGQHRRRE